jgi:hypothetical protein
MDISYLLILVVAVLAGRWAAHLLINKKVRVSKGAPNASTRYWGYAFLGALLFGGIGGWVGIIFFNNNPDALLSCFAVGILVGACVGIWRVHATRTDHSKDLF